MADAPTWTVIDLAVWKLVPDKWGGGRGYIQRYKDAWVRYNRLGILAAAARYSLPPELIAGVCWIEVGGDPSFIDRVAFTVRAFDWSGPDLIDKLTITKRPELTSFGPVSIQLRVAAATLGLNPKTMTYSRWSKLASALSHDTYNIDVSSRHLRSLVNHDGFQTSLPKLRADQVRIVGARYNRGAALSLDQIKRNTSYGSLIVKLWSRFTGLLR